MIKKKNKNAIAIIVLLLFSLLLLVVGFSVSHSAMAAQENAGEYIPECKTIYTTINDCDEIAEDVVFVVLTRRASRNFSDFTPSDFPEIKICRVDCITPGMNSMQNQLRAKNSRRDNSYYYDSNRSLDINNFRRILRFTLSEPSRQNAISAIRILEQRFDVKAAEPRFLDDVSYATVIPNDHYFDHSNLSLRQWSLHTIQMPYAWGISTGNNQVRVGIVGYDVNADHEDLVGRVCRDLHTTFGPNPLVASSGTPNGTMQAGIIAANADNGIGIAGISWNAKISVLNVDIDEAIFFAEANNIPILTQSASGRNIVRRLQAIKQFEGLIVNSAGNDGRNIDTSTDVEGNNYFLYPARWRLQYELSNLIVVGASSQSDRIALFGGGRFSNYGRRTVCVFAPGLSIRSTALGNTYGFYNGTSAAAPIVAGLASLLLSANPNLTPAQIRQILIDTVDTTNCPHITNHSVSGGRVNAHRAISSAILRSTQVGNTIRIDGIINNFTLPSGANLLLPERINGLFVTSIGSNAFINQSRLNQIVIHPRITSIGANAFPFPVHVVLAEGRTSIQAGLFQNQIGVSKITLPSTLISIGANAFHHSGLSNIVSNATAPILNSTALNPNLIYNVIIPAGSRQSYINFGWSGLNLVEMQVSQAGVLSRTSGLLEASFTIPTSFRGQNVTSLASNFANNHTRLNHVTIPSSTIGIPTNAFYINTSVYLSGMFNTTEIPTGIRINGISPAVTTLPHNNIFIPQSINGRTVTHIGDMAFMGDSRISQISIPMRVTHIGFASFFGMQNLRRVQFSFFLPSLQSIGGLAFGDTPSLNAISIPQTVTTMGANVFSGWTSSQLISLIGRNSAPSGWVSNWNGSNARVSWNLAPLEFELVSASSSSAWDVAIMNRNQFAVSVTYNTRLAFQGDARNHTNLHHLRTITIPANSWYIARIQSNAAAGFMTARINHTQNDIRMITYAYGLRSSPSRITPPHAINITTSGGGCVLEGTYITLYDGSRVRVENLRGDEYLRIWNFYTGQFDAKQIFFINSGERMKREILHLQFADGTYIRMTYQHAFFNITLNRFVDIHARNYYQFVGDYFKRYVTGQNGELTWQAVRLNSVNLMEKYARVFAPQTLRHFSKYANGFLAAPSDHEPFLNVFEVDRELLVYCADAREEAIATFGLMTFEEFSAIVPIVPEFFFDAFRGEYLSIMIGNGSLTWEHLFYLLEKYADLLGGIF